MIESPINYMRSKYTILDKLIPLFPKADCFVDLFTGGGSVYMNIANKYKKVIANDIIEDLIDIHRSLKDKEFIKIAGEMSTMTKDSQDVYLTLRDYYNKENGGPEALLALIWSCNSNMMRFNMDFKFNQTWGKRSFNKNTLKKCELYQMNNYSNVEFVSKKFYDVIIPNNAFVYLDPPYSNTEAGYNVFWKQEDDDRLIKLIESFIEKHIPFGLSGVDNGKPNAIFDRFKGKLFQHTFGDLYQKISKKEKTNVEYYITNIGEL